MTEYLDIDDILAAGSIACEFEVIVADQALLESAASQPMMSAFGSDAYPGLFDKAAALLRSIACNHSLVDGNKRTAWAAAWTFLEINGVPIPSPVNADVAEQLILDVVGQGGGDDWSAIARRLKALTEVDSLLTE